MKAKFDPCFGIKIKSNPMGFEYEKDCFGPEPENRSLDSIRKSLLDPNCEGPDPVYSIAMDVGKIIHRSILVEKKLLFGAVTYAAGKLGLEPVRSQGHVHKKVRGNKLSPPEIYEIWTGKAVIYMQEFADKNPGRCFAVNALPGEVVIVPPNWAHATISADPNEPLTFGAWCDREYGFEYDAVRALKGLAWYPILNESNKISWRQNTLYEYDNLNIKVPNTYIDFGIKTGKSIYQLFEEEPDIFLYVSNPELKKDLWNDFVP
jgi:glucose-6-phosphate isomerase